MTTTALRGTNYAFSRTTECLALLTTDITLRVFETGAAVSRLEAPIFVLFATGSGKCFLNLQSRQNTADPGFLRQETKNAMVWGPSAKVCVVLSHSEIDGGYV